MTWMQVLPALAGVLLFVSLGAWAQSIGSAEWELAFEYDFVPSSSLDGWHMDGAGEAVVTGDGRLRITTERRELPEGTSKASVFWHKTPVWGDVRIEFDCRAEPESRVILFFNARSTESGSDPFNWPRPLATYGDYAYEPRLEMYTVGLLRSDQTNLNLRYLGRDIPEEWIRVMPYHPTRHPERYLEPGQLNAALVSLGLEELPVDLAERHQLTQRAPFPQLLAPHVTDWEKVNRGFQEVSIIANHESEEPIFADPQKWYHVQMTSVGNRITVRVDDQVVIDHVDAAREGRPLRGGYFALRNFRPTTVWYDNLRVHARSAEAP